MAVSITHYCPACRTRIEDAGGWYIEIGPMVVRCSNPECEQMLIVKGAYEWETMPGALRGVYIIAYGFTHFLFGFVGGFVVGEFFPRTFETLSNSAFQIGFLGGLLGLVRWGYALRQEIVKSKRRMADPVYRHTVDTPSRVP